MKRVKNTRPKMTPAQRRAWKQDERRLIEANSPKPGDQHTRCDYCGRSYLIVDGVAAGCGPCVNIVNWMPQAGKIMLDAVIYRLKALEALRQVHESDVNYLRSQLPRPAAKRKRKGKKARR